MQTKIIISLFLAILFLQLNGQQTYNDPDGILIGGDKVPKVLLVGTFHFGYPGMDEHKTKEKNKVNIRSREKQKEVKELVEYIARFKPTKIMVEAGRNTGYLMHRYKRWRLGLKSLQAREIDQIAFRLMKEFELDTIYGTNARAMTYDLYNSKDSLIFRPFMEQLTDGEYPENPVDARYDEFYDYSDRMSVEMSLLDFFKEENSDKVINRMHGHYILNDNSKNYDSMDYLAIWWYSRNLRIFRNIQNVETTGEDRILVLYGSGHIPILKHLFESSPEYELVKFGDL